MKRYPAYDPPEYRNWRPDDSLVASFRATIDGQPDRAEIVADMTDEDLLELYRGSSDSACTTSPSSAGSSVE